MFGLHETVDAMCSSREKLSQEQKLRVLRFFHAMQRCLGPVCDIRKPIDNELNQLLDSPNIDDFAFCACVTRLLQEIRVPLNSRSLETNLLKQGLSLEDLNRFNELSNEDDIYNHMQHLWETLKSKNKKAPPNSFKKILDIALLMDFEKNYTRPLWPDYHPKPTQQLLIKPAVMFQMLRNDKINTNRSESVFTHASLAIMAAVMYKDKRSLSRQWAKKYQFALQESIDIGKHTATSKHATDAMYFFINECVQTDAMEPIVDFEYKFNEVVENYLGPKLDSSHDIEDMGEIIYHDQMWGVICDLWDYQHPISFRKKPLLMPNFKTLSEDIIELQAAEFDVESNAYQLKWQKMKNGIMKRVWFSTNVESDEIIKFRSLLRFFPTPYSSYGRRVLNLLLPSPNCKVFNNEGKKEDEASKPKTTTTTECGCSCFCSTTLGMMIANEVGLLGIKIHVVLASNHIYLAVGDKDINLKDKKVTVIETTRRSDDFDEDKCSRSLVSLTKKGLYSNQDYVGTHIYEFLLSDFAILFKSSSAKMQLFWKKLFLEKVTNFWGAASLLAACSETVLDELVEIPQIRRIFKNLMSEEIATPSLSKIGVNDISISQLIVMKQHFLKKNRGKWNAIFNILEDDGRFEIKYRAIFCQ